MNPFRSNCGSSKCSMPILIDTPLLTRLYDGWDSFELEPGSTYIHGTSVEARSIYPETWEHAAKGVNFVQFSSFENTPDKDFSRCIAETSGVEKTLYLRGSGQLLTFFSEIKSDVVYLDITGLPHHVWAPLLKAAVATPKQVCAVYVEPRSYTFSPTPTESEIFDLSENIHGILPLPGFSVLSEPEDEELVLFVPFLGFEGHRFAYVMEHVQPLRRNIVPIIGVPGFRPEFPFHTYLGNRNILADGNLHTRVRHAKANSVFDAFYLLQDIAEDYPQHTLKIAPIGTKPHALGAVLFTLWTQRSVEIVYDHPIRKPNRTLGSANILVYEIEHLLSSSPT